MTTTDQPTTHTLDVPGATLTYDVRRNDASTEPILLLIGSPMGAAGFGTLAGHFADRTVVTYDPRGVERSAKTDPASPVDARRARRRPASDHPGARRRAGRPVRQQRRRGQRAGARGAASGGRADARRARAAARRDPARPRARAGRRAARSTRPTSAAAGAPGWRTSSPSSATRDRSPPSSPTSPAPDPAMFGMPTEDDGSRDRPDARPEHDHRAPTTSPTSTRCGPRRRGSSSPPARSRRARWRTAAPTPSPSGSARSR